MGSRMPLSFMYFAKRWNEEGSSLRYSSFTRVLKHRIVTVVTILMAGAGLTGAAAADGGRLMILGDSLTAGHGLPQEEAFPVKLQAALRAKGHKIEVINSGVSGDTTAGGLATYAAWYKPAERPDETDAQFLASDEFELELRDFRARFGPPR